MDADASLLYNRPRAPWRRLWLAHRYSLILFAVLFVTVLSVWHLLSDKDFSFLMVRGAR